MIGIGLVATGFVESDHLKKGKPDVLFNGVDYLGNICGITNFTNQNNENILDQPMTYFLPSGVSICIESCPEVTELKQFHCKYEVEAFITEQIKSVQARSGEIAANNTKQSLYLYYTSTEECMPYLKSSPYLGYCVSNVIADIIGQQIRAEYENYSIITDSNLTVAKNGISGGEFFDETMADTYLARHVILAFGVGGALLFGFLYLALLRLPGTTYKEHCSV